MRLLLKCGFLSGFGIPHQWSTPPAPIATNSAALVARRPTLYLASELLMATLRYVEYFISGFIAGGDLRRLRTR